MNNKERYNQLIDDAYKNYLSNWKPSQKVEHELSWMEQEFVSDRPLPKDWFIDKIKTDDEFAKKWGVQVEIRELSLEEKEWQLEKTNCINDIENDRIIYGHEWEKYIQEQYDSIQSTQRIKIPTRVISLSYKNETVEVYE